MEKLNNLLKQLILVIFFVSLQGVNGNLAAQEGVKIKKLTTPVTFDGMPSEDAWQLLGQFPLTMHKPNFGTQPSEKSEVWIGYDDQFLWVGARLYMSDAAKIFSVSSKRDEELRDYDAFGIVLDTYNDNENALAFFTAPTGLRSDYTISGDAAGMGGGPQGPSFINYSWNTFWDVKTTRDDQGWYVEMRIPFSSLKFKSENDLATMGIIVSRNISANNETDTYPAIEPKYGMFATSKPSQAQTIEIAGARPTKPVYVSPYVLGGFARDWSLNETESGYIRSDDPRYNAGIDIKYNINSNLTLDLTGNTDFAQVEADDQQVNLTRYSLFFPEKRKFFQERTNLFDFSLGDGQDNLFYSRNIGIAGREQVGIYGGARLTGRVGNWDLGFLDMQTAKSDASASENFGVLRMRRQVINQNSYVGGILTSRLGVNGTQNLAYGIDGIFRLFGDDYLNVKWSQTYDSESGNSLGSLDPSFIGLNWERRSEEGFAYRMNYTYAGEQFKPGIGFIRREAMQGVSGNLMYGWIPGEQSKLFKYSMELRGDRYTRLEDGGLESMQVSPEFQILTKKGIFTSAGMELKQEGVIREFGLSDSISIAPGDYTFIASSIRFGTYEARKLSVRLDIEAGEFYDGNQVGLEAETAIKLSSKFNLTGAYQFNAIRFPERAVNNSLNIHSLNFKALYMFNTKLSATMLLQYVNTEDEMIANFRLRYNPREGNDFYLVYNDFRGISDRIAVPEKPGFFNKTIMVKYIHTFIL